MHIITILLVLLLPFVSCFAVDTVGDDFGSEKLDEDAPTRRHQVNLEYDYIGKAKFTNGFPKGEKFDFGEGEATARTVVFFNPKCNEGLTLEIGYSNTYLGWSQNIFFDQRDFNTVSIELGGWSRRLCNWFWQGLVAMNLDVDHYEFDYYTTWDILLWGRYTYTPTVGIHTGFYAQTGMKVDRFFPILGFDWQFRPKWKLNAVFPVNISLVYSLTRRWNISLAGRFFDSRHRTADDEEDEGIWPMAIFEYRTVGAEFAIDYNYRDRFLFNVHGGSTFGGKLKISNKHHADGRHYKFNPAPYVGGQLTLKF